METISWDILSNNSVLIAIDLKTIHASLERTDRVNLSDIDNTPKVLTFLYACSFTIIDETQRSKECKAEELFAKHYPRFFRD